MSGLVNTSLPGTGGVSLWNLGPTEVQQDERADHTMLISLDNYLNFRSVSESINIGRVGEDWVIDGVDPNRVLPDFNIFLAQDDLSFSGAEPEFSNVALGTRYPDGDFVLNANTGNLPILDVLPFLWEDKVLTAKYIGTSNIISVAPHVLNDVISDELVHFK